MAIYSANHPNKTLVIHKPDCRVIPKDKLQPCGCGETGERGNQYWFCEAHVTRKAVEEFMNGRFWAVLICDLCFRDEREHMPVMQAKPVGPLEEQFRQAMLKVAELANAPRFKQMIERSGAVEAAKRLLAKPEIQPGMIRIRDMGRLDMTMEAHVIQPQFKPLFTPAEIAEARRRLDMLGFFK